ncbi:MAG TPA: MucR family transcriptional regulator [Rhizomicrobium sp.]
MLRHTVSIVVAYVGHNSLPAGELNNVIRDVQTAITSAHGGGAVRATTQKPAVPVKKSITADYLVCLEDGKKLKMLKRYIRSRFGLSPDDYRAKWGLPRDYPMVASSYAAKRSEFAKRSGLGRKRPAPAKKRKRS